MGYQKNDDYVEVNERIVEFRVRFPDGSLQPLNLEKPYEFYPPDAPEMVIYAAAAYRTPDDPRPGVGVVSEPYPGKTPYTKGSELANAETSAWGRAIVAALAADTNRSVASANEVRNRIADNEAPEEPTELEVALAELMDIAKAKGIKDDVKELAEENYGKKVPDLSLNEVREMIKFAESAP